MIVSFNNFGFIHWFILPSIIIPFYIKRVYILMNNQRKISSKKAAAHRLRLPTFYIDFRNFSIT